MNNEDEKVGKFLQAINDYAEEQRKRILDEVREYYSAEVERAEKEALSDAQQLVEREKAQNRNRILHRRLVHHDSLEAALQSRILLNIHPVLVQRGSADAVQLASCQHRL